MVLGVAEVGFCGSSAAVEELSVGWSAAGMPCSSACRLDQNWRCAGAVWEC